MVETAIVQIGNSDDKLSQTQWSKFIKRTHDYLRKYMLFHFTGASEPTAEWQNYCFVGVISHLSDDEKREMVKGIAVIRDEFNQDSIAVTIGETGFV